MTAEAGVPRLRVVDAHATPEEIAAIVAAVGALTAGGAGDVEETADDTLHEWVRASRLQARRSTLQRGSWRMAARMGRRPLA